MDRLDDDTFIGVFQHLSAKDILACSQVCRKMNGVIRNSSILQLTLYQHLFPPPEYMKHKGSYENRKFSSSREELERLIGREKNFTRLTPRYSSFRIPEDQEILSIHDDAFITVPSYRRSHSHDHNQVAVYDLAIVWTMTKDHNGGEVELKSKTIQVDFDPLKGRIVADMEQGVVIKMEDNWPTDRIHVFNIKVKDPEEEIVVTHHHFELKVEFHRYASEVGMDLGQHGKLIIWDNRRTFVYDWRSGVRQNEIIVPGGKGDADWVGFVGPDLWAVMASRLVERLHPKTDLDLLMVYDLSNLTTPDADEFTTLNDQRQRLGPYWPSDGSNGTSDLLHLAVDRTAWNPAHWGEHKALSISLPYFKIRKWLQSNASYAAQSTDGKRYNINDHIIIEATEWTKQTHCAFMSNRPRYISDCHYGSKLVLCENMHDRRQDAEVIAQEGTNADLTGPRRYQITCRDYNSLKVKYNLSTSESEFGGLKSIDYVRSDLPVETQVGDHDLCLESS